MRNVVAATLAVALIAGPAPVAGPVQVAGAHHRNPDRDVPCERIHWRNRNLEDTQEAVRRLIRCAQRRWSVPGGAEKALAVARCESRFIPWAYGGGNAGVYQHNLAYWRQRWVRWGSPLGLRSNPYNARSNVVVTMRMVHASQSWAPWACA